MYGIPLPESNYFESTPQSFTNTLGASISVQHGLGVVPSRVDVRLVCKNATQGYAVGDVIFLSTSLYDSGAGILLFADASVVGYIIGTSGQYRALNKASGGDFIPSSSDWDIVFKAFA